MREMTYQERVQAEIEQIKGLLGKRVRDEQGREGTVAENFTEQDGFIGGISRPVVRVFWDGDEETPWRYARIDRLIRLPGRCEHGQYAPCYTCGEHTV